MPKWMFYRNRLPACTCMNFKQISCLASISVQLTRWKLYLDNLKQTTFLYFCRFCSFWLSSLWEVGGEVPCFQAQLLWGCRGYRGAAGLRSPGVWDWISAPIRTWTVGPRTSSSFSRCLSFLICKKGLTILPLSWASWKDHMGYMSLLLRTLPGTEKVPATRLLLCFWGMQCR